MPGGIAHDFNNILATISGYSEMLQEDLPKDSVLSDNVSKIQGAVLKSTVNYKPDTYISAGMSSRRRYQ